MRLIGDLVRHFADDDAVSGPSPRRSPPCRAARPNRGRSCTPAGSPRGRAARRRSENRGRARCRTARCRSRRSWDRAGDLVLDQVRDRVADLADVVRRDVRRHADRDPRAAVDEQLRQARRQHDRLFGLTVEVRNEVDGVLVDVRQHVDRGTRQTRFGVPVGRRRIGIDRTEVAVTVDQRIAQREVLRHAHERVVAPTSRRADDSS